MVSRLGIGFCMVIESNSWVWFSPLFYALIFKKLILGYHRRTGNFFPGGEGAVNHLPTKNLAGCPNYYERVGKRGRPYYNNIGRTGI